MPNRGYPTSVDAVPTRVGNDAISEILPHRQRSDAQGAEGTRITLVQQQEPITIPTIPGAVIR